MKKILFFPNEKSRLAGVLKEIYHVIPVDTSLGLGDYSPIADVLVVDATEDFDKAVEFVRVLKNNRDFGVVVCVSREELYIQEEFLKLGAYSIIRENYSINTLQAIINQVIQDVKGRRGFVEMDDWKDMERNVSRSTTDVTHTALVQAVKSKEALKEFSRILTAGYDLDKLLSVFMNVLQEMLKVSRIAIFLEDNGMYKIKVCRGISHKIVEYISLPADGEIVRYLRKEGTVLRLDSVQSMNSSVSFAQRQGVDLVSEMYAVGVVTLVPLWENGRIIGVIGFNKKVTGMPVTDEELELVFALGNQVAVAIENTKLVELTSKQRNYLKNILNNVSCGVITADKDFNVITYNPKAEEILGIKRKDVFGKTLDVLPENVAVLLRESVCTGTVCFRKELKLKEPGGFIGVSVTPIKTERGQVIGSVMIFTDLSPIKELERETRRLDQLEFTNTVAMRSSHELKNCLVSIKTFAQLLPERYMDKQFREDFYLVVDKEVDRLNQVVENLLFFAQPLGLDVSSCGIEDLMQDVLGVLEKDGLLEGIEIVKEFEPEGGTFDVDRDAMLRALKALFYNSIQAMPKGGKIHIITRNVEKADKSFSELKIIDQGIGIQPDIIDKVWDPFFTTKSRGIGLGMTILRKIIEAHGGNITISSQSFPNKGTEVTMLFPRVISSKKKETLYFPSGRKVVV